MSARRALTRLGDDLEAMLGRGDGGAGILGSVVGCLAVGLEAGVIAHRPELTTEGWASEQMVVSRDPRMDRVAALTRTFLPTAPLRYAHFDALTVQPDQQNRVLGDAEIRAACRREQPVVIREVYQPAGVANLSHMRVVLSDGPFLLSWLGLWREEAFTPAEERVLARATPALVARLSIERLLWAGSPGSFDALGHALELVGRPAFVVNPAGQLVFANETGRALLDRDLSIVEDATAAALRGSRSPRIHSVTPIGAAGAQRHVIVLVTEDPRAADGRLHHMIREHKLSATEARVLAQLVRGDANKDIATKLGSASRTIEVHVTSILKKCRVETRGRLIARFWSEG